MKKFGLSDEFAQRQGLSVNVAVLIAWLLPVAVGLYYIFKKDGVFPAYLVVPCWIACGVLYIALSKVLQDKSKQSDA